MEYTLGILRLVFLALITIFFMKVLLVLNKNMECEKADSAQKPEHPQKTKRFPGKTSIRLTIKEGWDLVNADRDYAASIDQILKIGRADDNHIIVKDPFASNYHVEIIPAGDEIIIKDLGSSNGTVLNGEALAGERQLKAGDEIRIGTVTFSIEDTGGA